MAETSDSNRSTLYLFEESTWNETPGTPTMLEFQRTSDTLNHQKQTEVPKTIRSDRAQEDLIFVGAGAQGDVAIELRAVQYDNFLAAAIGAASFTIVAITASDISAATADDSFNRVSGSFITDGIVVGMWIKVAGFTGAGVVTNNTNWRVLTVAALKITVDGNLADDAAGEPITITSKMARNGVVKRSFLLEKRFLDIAQYEQFNGMRVDKFTITARNRSIITGTISFMGAKGLYTGSSVAGSSTPAASNPAMDASNNLASIVEGGSLLTTPLFNITLEIAANAAMQPAIANRYPIGIRLGTLMITGTIEAYFQDLALANKFINHTSSSLTLKIQDPNGKILYVTIPKIYYAEGTTPVTGENADVFLTLPFRASFDATSGFVVQVDSL